MASGSLKSFKEKLAQSHRNNTEKGVYGYMWWSAIKIILIYFLTLAPLILLIKKVFNLGSAVTAITDSLPDLAVIMVFFVSESFLGMIPPDIFTIWSAKFDSPFLVLAFLGILSYLGGVISYIIGSWLSRRKRIKEYIERRLQKYIRLVGKWGGAFIIIAALFPYSPYSMVVIAVSVFKFPFKPFLLFGLSRLARFIILGLFYFKLMHFDSLLT